ncbi:MAG TPA: homoserine O-succinyltransferase [Kiloniellaceae bacterium]|nr:homoserine O-succinyltransferase [Kiloniellaceae bacterium]
MPIKIPNDLPARAHLESEGLVVMSESDAVRQDIRPLKVALLNLMPMKETTETQIARLVGSTPLQVELTLVTTASYKPTNVSRAHMRDFYRPWDDVSKEKFDAFVITGAPIEKLPFEDVYYWTELTEIFDWTQTHVTQTLNLCWGAQAALYYFHGVPKYLLDKKLFGVFPHRVRSPNSPLLRGFTETFPVPVSRHTEVRHDDIARIEDLTVLADSDSAGLCLLEDKRHRHIYMFNHLEYDAWTLGDEYWRDKNQGLPIEVPTNYFPDDDPAQAPVNGWRAHGHLFILNWINHVYQTTPFDAEKIGAGQVGQGIQGVIEGGKAQSS